MNESEAAVEVPMKEGVGLSVGVKLGRCVKWPNVVDPASPTGFGEADYSQGPDEIVICIDDGPFMTVYKRGDR